MMEPMPHRSTVQATTGTKFCSPCEASYVQSTCEVLSSKHPTRAILIKLSDKLGLAH